MSSLVLGVRCRPATPSASFLPETAHVLTSLALLACTAASSTVLFALAQAVRF